MAHPSPKLGRISGPLPLQGFIAAPVSFPTFVTPIFGQNPSYLQAIGRNRVVQALVPISNAGLSPSRKLPFRSDTPAPRVAAGDEQIFAFAFGASDIWFGTHAYLTQVLSERFEELRNCPYVSMDVAAFIKNQDRMTEARKSVDAAVRTWRARSH